MGEVEEQGVPVAWEPNLAEDKLRLALGSHDGHVVLLCELACKHESLVECLIVCTRANIEPLLSHKVTRQ